MVRDVKRNEAAAKGSQATFPVDRAVALRILKWFTRHTNAGARHHDKGDAMFRRSQNTIASAFLCLAALSACGQFAQETHRPDTAALFRSLKEAGAAWRTGTIEGNLYLAHPGLPTVLRDWSVTLLPLSPEQEAAISEAHERYISNAREPMPADLFQQARRLLDRFASQTKELGYGELIRTATTDTKEGKFVFSDVPEGRWLLTAELPGKFSTLLWARPVTVTAGKMTTWLLNDTTIWLEGLTL